MSNNRRYIRQALFQRIKDHFTYRTPYNENYYADTNRFIYWCFFWHSSMLGIYKSVSDDGDRITIRGRVFIDTLRDGALCGLFSPIVLPVLAFRTMKQIGA